MVLARDAWQILAKKYDYDYEEASILLIEALRKSAARHTRENGELGVSFDWRRVEML